MLNINEEFVNKTAPNQSAISNGQGLVKKDSFVKLSISHDETILFGECKGSGASNYTTSCDFSNMENPVFRCSCPSRQFPCKHSLGLMYAYINGKKFDVAEIPEDLVQKREKAQQREEKKKEKSQTEPKKVNKNALEKKIKTQKEGLALLEKIVASIAKAGLGTINIKTLTQLEDQINNLGNYYIPGAQVLLRELKELFNNNGDNEKIYLEAVDLITRIYAICKKGNEYLDKKLADPDLSMDKESTIDEWLGQSWQLAELKAAGLVENDAELVQLSFNSICNNARREYVDIGVWINLKSGQIVETKNYRPFKALKYIKEEDSFYSVAQINELCVQPGDLNPRVRWEGMTMRDITSKDYSTIISQAKSSYQEVFKVIRNQIKNPLSSKYPVVLLKFSDIKLISGNYVIEGLDGQKLVLSDKLTFGEQVTNDVLSLLKKENLKNQVALVRFFNDFEEKRLYGKILSIVKVDEIVRLTF